MGLSLIFFVLFVLYDTNSIGLENLLPKFENFDLIFDILLWSIFVVMIPDLAIKYKKAENWKAFLKKNWIDILFFILIPLFAGMRALKLLQFGSQLKTIKLLQSFLKVVYEARRVIVPGLFGYRLVKILQRKRKLKKKINHSQFCDMCGNELHPENNFCLKCGKP